jgi:thymidine phosphorylase
VSAIYSYSTLLHVTFEAACAVFRGRKYHQFDIAADVVIAEARDGLSDLQVDLLCRSLAASGDNVCLPSELAPFIDVPSSGGPASLTTLLCPLLIASFGFHVPKLSATGSIAGGIDTMAIIPGFRANLSGAAFVTALRRSRFAHAEPSKTFCPADKNLVRKRRAAKMMENPKLATASLLAKKLATPNTQAVFDFRVGPAGNIGEDLVTARNAKRLLIRIARRLGLNVDVVLTDNRIFSSTALGRLESLFLLWRILSNRSLLQIDEDHVALCIEISAKACLLVQKNLSLAKTKQHLKNSLRVGEVKKTFLTHLRAQGASLDSFERVLRSRESQKATTVVSSTSGYWIPPDLNQSKEWLKRQQTFACKSIHLGKGKQPQLGIQLLRTRGEFVRTGGAVVQFRYPREFDGITIPSWLAGQTRKSSIANRPQLLD